MSLANSRRALVPSDLPQPPRRRALALVPPSDVPAPAFIPDAARACRTCAAEQAAAARELRLLAMDLARVAGDLTARAERLVEERRRDRPGATRLHARVLALMGDAPLPSDDLAR